jgi:hypothetical protein
MSVESIKSQLENSGSAGLGGSLLISARRRVVTMHDRDPRGLQRPGCAEVFEFANGASGFTRRFPVLVKPVAKALSALCWIRF